MHRRKGLEPYPSPYLPIRIIDTAAIFAGIVGPLMAMPQLYRIYIAQDASGLEPLSWFSWAILNLVFIAYALVHRDRVILTTYSAWFCINLAVGVGAIIYG
jgi:uncharacterized protein with PQ loop repeat